MTYLPESTESSFRSLPAEFLVTKFSSKSQAMPPVVSAFRGMTSESVMSIPGMLNVHVDSMGTVPNVLIVHQLASFCGSPHAKFKFPSRMRLNDTVLLRHLDDVQFGKQTSVARDLVVKDCSLLALHPDIVIGGTLRAVNSVILIPEQALAKIYKIDADVQYVTYNAKARASQVLSKLFPTDHVARKQRRSLVQNVIRAESIAKAQSFFTTAVDTFIPKLDLPELHVKGIQGKVGHHTIIEDCTILNLNSSCVDLDDGTSLFFDNNTYFRDKQTEKIPDTETGDALVIENCKNLRTLAGSFSGDSLVIDGCDNLTEISARLNFKSLVITNCKNLKLIRCPDAIQHVTIMQCPNLSEFTLLCSPRFRKVLAEQSLYSQPQHAYTLNGRISKNTQPLHVFKALTSLANTSSVSDLNTARTLFSDTTSNLVVTLDVRKTLLALGMEFSRNQDIIDSILNPQKAIPTNERPSIKDEYEKISTQVLLECLSQTSETDTQLHQTIQNIITSRIEEATHTKPPKIRLKL